MTNRERFLKIMSHRPADGLPLMEIEGREQSTAAPCCSTALSSR